MARGYYSQDGTEISRTIHVDHSIASKGIMIEESKIHRFSAIAFASVRIDPVSKRKQRQALLALILASAAVSS
jgi:hypothetical protein